MPDIPDRDEIEREFARRVARLNNRQLAELLASLGDPPNLDKLASWILGNQHSNYQVINRILGPIYARAAITVASQTPLQLSRNLVNRAAAQWAENYTYDKVKEITETTVEKLQDAVSKFFTEGWTTEQLDERILGSFPPSRAELIATTETTRAATEGERYGARELAKAGIVMVPFWFTNNDEIVRRCPICWPRHEQRIESDYPPGHPGCRCWTNYELEEEQNGE